MRVGGREAGREGGREGGPLSVYILHDLLPEREAVQDRGALPGEEGSLGHCAGLSCSRRKDAIVSLDGSKGQCLSPPSEGGFPSRKEPPYGTFVPVTPMGKKGRGWKYYSIYHDYPYTSSRRRNTTGRVLSSCSRPLPTEIAAPTACPSRRCTAGSGTCCPASGAAVAPSCPGSRQRWCNRFRSSPASRSRCPARTPCRRPSERSPGSGPCTALIDVRAFVRRGCQRVPRA